MPKRQMIINYVPGEECRIAITEDGRLEEFYQERASAESHVGNIYKGKVTNVEPSIQAAFVDFGLERNGFLHISDLHPKYFPGDAKEETEQVGLKTPRRDRPPIQKCLRRGQEILVQVLKEGIGTKGPTLTSYLSIPGRFLVMMPDMERLGVSRKVEDDEARREMRDILNELKPPEGFGFIIRTAGIGRTKLELKRDLAYLQRLWKTIDKRMGETRVGELFAESDLVIRTIRDIYSSDIERVIIDDATAARRAQDFLSISNPRSGSNVMVYRDQVPIFHRYDIERQIETINARTVPLPSGGSLVIDSTEALVAIDVNSGKSRESRDAEMTAWKTNIEAVTEICRQLRLRDLGGVVVLDLIDMRDLKHRRDIEQRVRDLLKRDRARTRYSPISQFGIVEMTRQRMRPSLKKSIYMDCRACHGQGEVKSPESVVLDVMRRLAMVLQRQVVSRVELIVSPDVAFQLLNHRRGGLVALEQQYGKAVLVRVNGEGALDSVGITAFDARDGQIESEVREAMSEPELEAVEAIQLDVDLDVFEELPADEGSAYDETEEPASTGLDPETQSEPNFASEHAEEELSPSDESPEMAASQGDTARDGAAQPSSGGEPGQEGRRKRRRRGRRGRGRGRGQNSGEQQQQSGQAFHSHTAPSPSPDTRGEQHSNVVAHSPQAPTPLPGDEMVEDDHPQPMTHESAPLSATLAAKGEAPANQEQEGGRKRRRRRGGRRRRGRGGNEGEGGGGGGNAAPPAVPSGGQGHPNIVKHPARASGGHANANQPSGHAGGNRPTPPPPSSPTGNSSPSGNPGNALPSSPPPPVATRPVTTPVAEGSPARKPATRGGYRNYIRRSDTPPTQPPQG